MLGRCAPCALPMPWTPSASSSALAFGLPSPSRPVSAADRLRAHRIDMHLAPPADRRDDTGHFAVLDMAGHDVAYAAELRLGQSADAHRLFLRRNPRPSSPYTHLLHRRQSEGSATPSSRAEHSRWFRGTRGSAMRGQPPAAVGDERRQEPHHQRDQRRRDTAARAREDRRTDHDDHEAGGGQRCQARSKAQEPGKNQADRPERPHR